VTRHPNSARSEVSPPLTNPAGQPLFLGDRVNGRFDWIAPRAIQIGPCATLNIVIAMTKSPGSERIIKRTFEMKTGDSSVAANKLAAARRRRLREGLSRIKVGKSCGAMPYRRCAGRRAIRFGPSLASHGKNAAARCLGGRLKPGESIDPGTE